MRDVRVEKKLFFAWGEDKEIKWLKEMAREGWELEYAAFCEYHFKKTEKQELNFSFDYRVLKTEELEEYIQHFESCGWEYISSVANWHYFKSKASDTLFPDIYSENSSKIEKYNRLLMTLILSAALSNWFIIYNLGLLNEESSSFIFFLLLSIFLFILFMDCVVFYGIYRIYRIIQRLKKNL